MNSICELREYLITNKIDIIDSCGWYLITANYDTWALALGVYFLNGHAVEKKQITEYIKKPQIKAKRTMKMISNSSFYEDIEEENDNKQNCSDQTKH